MAKTLVSVRLSDEAISILKTLCEKEDRSQAYIIEKLLEKAAPEKPKKKAKTS
jgi:predicted DNA-binding protein